MEQNTARVRIGEARDALRTSDGITGQSARRFDEIAGRFELFARRGFEVDHLDKVTTTHVEQFVRAKSKGSLPSIATMHLPCSVLRAPCSVLRVRFRVARLQLGFDGDPTMDLLLPPQERTVRSAAYERRGDPWAQLLAQHVDRNATASCVGAERGDGNNR